MKGNQIASGIFKKHKKKYFTNTQKLCESFNFCDQNKFN